MENQYNVYGTNFRNYVKAQKKKAKAIYPAIPENTVVAHSSRTCKLGTWSLMKSDFLPRLACKLVVMKWTYFCDSEFQVCGRLLSKDWNDLHFSKKSSR